MDMQEMFDALMAKSKAVRMAQSEQRTLGEVTLMLQRYPRDAQIYVEKEGGMYRPERVESYRGYYSDLAIPYGDGTDSATLNTVGEVLDNLLDADGKTFQGYKGGDFTMHRGTPLWVALYSTAGGIGVIGVDQTEDGSVVIRTDLVDEAYI